MAHITADRVRQISTSTGTGTFVLSSSITGFRTFASVLAVSDTFWYAIASFPGSEWEVGLGTYSAANTITRTTVLASSNAGAAVTFSAGDKEVFITAAASKFLQQDSAGSYGNFTAGTITGSGLTITGTSVLGSGRVRGWTATDTDIDGLISGSTTGLLLEGANSAHFTVGLRSNDLGDGFQVISKGAATTPDTDPFTTLCFEVKANGNVTWAGTATGTSFNSITGLSATTPVVAGTAAIGTATTTARADHVHPAQTTISGNAGTATALATVRTLWGQNFSGIADVTGNLTSVGNITGTAGVTLTATAGTLALTATGANIITATNNGSERLRIDSTGRAGIGTNAPSETLHVSGTNIRIDGTTGEAGVYMYRANAQAPDMRFFASGGTIATPTASVNSNLVGQIHWQAHDGTTYQDRAGIYSVIDGVVSTGTVPMALRFLTGTTSLLERMRIHSSGGVSVGVTSDPGNAGLRLGRQDSTIEGGQIDFCRSADNTTAWAIDTYGSSSTTANDLRFVDTVAGATRASISPTGVFSFNSGYGSSAPVYGCRAWVNFDGTAAGTFPGGTVTVTRTAGSTTCNCTSATAHGLITGNNIYASFSNVVTPPYIPAGSYTVTVTGANTFTFVNSQTTAITTGTLVVILNNIRGDGNVTTVADEGIGVYLINFTTAMPDTNYAMLATVGMGRNPNSTGNGRDNDENPFIGEQTVYYARLYVEAADDTAGDKTFVSVAFFR